MANTLTTKWGGTAWSIFGQYILDSKPLRLFAASAALTACLLWYLVQGEAEPGDGWGISLAVEGYGFLMDIILFGLLWSIFDAHKERGAKIREYRNQLWDFREWQGEEGVLRKVGLIRRLNELRAELPNLPFICTRTDLS